MRTTVSIADDLLAAAKQRATEEGTTLGSVIEAALRRDLARPRAEQQVPTIPVFRGGDGPRPGIDLRSNRDLAEYLDEGRPLDQRR